MFINHYCEVEFFWGEWGIGVGHSYFTTVLVHPDVLDLLRGIAEHSEVTKVIWNLP